MAKNKMKQRVYAKRHVGYKCDFSPIYQHAELNWRALFLPVGPQGAGRGGREGGSTCRLCASLPGSRANHNERRMQTAAALRERQDAMNQVLVDGEDSTGSCLNLPSK